MIDVSTIFPSSSKELLFQCGTLRSRVSKCPYSIPSETQYVYCLSFAFECVHINFLLFTERLWDCCNFYMKNQRPTRRCSVYLRLNQSTKGQNGKILNIFLRALKLCQITASCISLCGKHQKMPNSFFIAASTRSHEPEWNPTMIDPQTPLFLPRGHLSGLIQLIIRYVITKSKLTTEIYYQRSWQEDNR